MLFVLFFKDWCSGNNRDREAKLHLRRSTMAFLAVPRDAANELTSIGDVTRHPKSESIIGILPRASASTAVRVDDHQTRSFEKNTLRAAIFRPTS
jgi:hypothetical protein